MNCSYLLTLITYLLFVSKPLLAVPFRDASSEVAPKSTSALTLRSTTQLPPPTSGPFHPSPRLKSRANMRTVATIVHFDSLAYGLRFSTYTQALPIKTAALALEAIYFDINFSLTPYGRWYNFPPQSRVLLRAGDMYLLFVAADPSMTVPWALVKEWARIMERMIDFGGFVGFYTASFQRLVGDYIIDYWVTTGIGSPELIAAAAA
ncbi:MAG: hypothetical protein L6R38_006185 [Xanthoria sp. 2 TBL-2021]|nr:MAG: hypothetical protein L6R38_006185 [Xanthoria sp. 2 TBL-2021]